MKNTGTTSGKKKILIIFGNIAFFGQERANYEVFKLLYRAGADLRILVNERGFDLHLKEPFERAGLPYTKICYPWQLRKPFRVCDVLLFFRDLWRCNWCFLQEYRRFRPDFIHIANDAMFLWLSPALSLVRARVIFRLGDRIPRWRIWRFLWKHWIVCRVERFIIDSDYIRGLLLEAGRKRDSGDIVLYAPPPERINPEESAAETELWSRVAAAREKGKIIVVYFGQLSRHKGCELLLEAAQSLAEGYREKFLFIFCGPVDRYVPYSQELENHVLKFGDPGFLLMGGYISNINKLLDMCDLHIAPTMIDESYGLVVVEAKSRNCPSIISDSGGMTELVESGKNGFVLQERTPAAIRSALLFYLEHPGEIVRQGEEARRSLEQLRITREYFRKVWLSVYEIEQP